MNKVRLDILNCQSGDIVGENIFNNEGALVVPKYTYIDEKIKFKLFEIGIRNINVFRKKNEVGSYVDFSKKYLKKINYLKDIIKSISSGETLNIEKINNLSDLVYEGVKDDYKIIQYLYKLQKIDEYTYCHSINVSYYSMLIAKWLGLKKGEIKEVIKSGLLHDIGKVKIPLNILNKKGKLNEKEFNIIKKHTIFGYNMLREITSLSEDIRCGVLMHHERENGSGYPNNIKKDKIHLYGKICAVADVYDALITDRVYKSKVSPFQAFEVLRSLVFGQLNSKIVFTFLNNINRYYIGTNVILNNGEVGTVVHISPISISKPIIKVNSKFIDLSKKKDLDIKYIL